MAKLIKDLFTFNFKKPKINEEDKQKKIISDRVKKQIEECIKENELIKKKLNKNETDNVYDRIIKLNAMMEEILNELSENKENEATIDGDLTDGDLKHLKELNRIQGILLYDIIKAYKIKKLQKWSTPTEKYRRRVKRQIIFLIGLIIIITLLIFIPIKVYEHYHSLPNHSFESGNLDGWIVESGNAFRDRVITRYIFSYHTYYESKEKNGKFFLWGYKVRDSATGKMRSKKFILDKPGKINFLLAGGNDIENVYITLVCNDKEIREFRRTGEKSESLKRININASEYIGQECYVKIVDNSRNGWGHINLDDINVPVKRFTE